MITKLVYKKKEMYNLNMIVSKHYENNWFVNVVEYIDDIHDLDMFKDETYIGNMMVYFIPNTNIEHDPIFKYIELLSESQKNHVIIYQNTNLKTKEEIISFIDTVFSERENITNEYYRRKKLKKILD
jgi:hypothetical protein